MSLLSTLNGWAGPGATAIVLLQLHLAQLNSTFNWLNRYSQNQVEQSDEFDSAQLQSQLQVNSLHEGGSQLGKLELN